MLLQLKTVSIQHSMVIYLQVCEPYTPSVAIKGLMLTGLWVRPLKDLVKHQQSYPQLCVFRGQSLCTNQI